MPLKYFIFIIILGPVISITSCSGGYKPVKPSKLQITDGEKLTYGYYSGEERAGGFIMVERISTNSGEVDIYINGIIDPTNKKIKMPENYSNYGEMMRVSLKTASLIDVYNDWTSNAVILDNKGQVAQDYIVDRTNSTVFYVEKFWDGKSVTTRESRIRIKEGFPVYDINSAGLIATRYIDSSGKGIFYVVMPWLFKEAIPASVKIIKKETVTVRAGKFAAVEMGMAITDPFLSMLLSKNVDRFVVWKEEAPRGLILKLGSPWGGD